MSLESFLWIGIILHILRKSGHVLLRIDILNMFARGVAIDSFIDLISWFGMLFGPVLLAVSKLEMISIISVSLVGFNFMVFGFGFLR